MELEAEEERERGMSCIDELNWGLPHRDDHDSLSDEQAADLMGTLTKALNDLNDQIETVSKDKLEKQRRSKRVKWLQDHINLILGNKK